MRLRSWVVSMTALLTAITSTAVMANNGCPPRTGGNYSGPRWYGYFYNNGHVSDNFDHTNMTMIGATVENDPDQQSVATTIILRGLAEAKRNGQTAMVDVESIVFMVGTQGNHACYQENLNAVADFQNLVQALEDNGYLVPNKPDTGTVAAFYVADEPDNNCLSDVYDSLPVANPALLGAISAIRQNPDTMNFPLATIVMNDHYPTIQEGMGMFDWVGLDDYGDDVTYYLDHFSTFEDDAHTTDRVGGTPQHFFLVPLVSGGIGTTYTNGAPYLQTKFAADDETIGIMPFQWDNKNGQGMVGEPWADSYIALGKSVLPNQHLIPTPEITTVIGNSLLLL